jgi:prolyl oligopeptidase
MLLGVAVLLLVLTPLACERRTPGLVIDYPPARTVNVTDVHHGSVVADPYRWLENLASEEVRSWAAAQTALASSRLRGDKLHSWIQQRIEVHAEPYDLLDEESVTSVAGFEFRLLRVTDSSRVALTVRAPGAVQTRTLVDPAERGPDWNIRTFRVSPDGRHVAYELTRGGSEWGETRVRRVVDGVDLPETVDGILFAHPLWTPGARGFFYVRYQRPTPQMREMFRGAGVYYHALGTDPARDTPILVTPEHDVEMTFELALVAGNRFLLIKEGTGASFEGFGWSNTRLHLVNLGGGTSPNLDATPVPITPGYDAAYLLGWEAGSELYLLTDLDAPRRRIMALDLNAPSVENWREVVPETTDVLQSARLLGNAIVAVYSRDTQPFLRVFDRRAVFVRDIALPPLAMVHDFWEGQRPGTVEIQTSSFLWPFRTTAYDLVTGAAAPVSGTPMHLDTTRYEARQVWYPSAGRTALKGNSYGGLMASAVMTERPDLWGAVIAEVPVTDNLRFGRGRHSRQYGRLRSPSTLRTSTHTRRSTVYARTSAILPRSSPQQ